MLRTRGTSILSVLLLATPGFAQTSLRRDTTAHLTGIVASIFDGKPLSDVLVSVPAARAFTLTDSAGGFDLTGLPAGVQTIRIAHRDGRTREYAAVLRPGTTKRLAVLLDVDAVNLAPIVVEASGMDSRWGMAGFYARRRYAFGRFFTAADIARRKPETLQNLIAGAGISYGCAGSGCGPLTFARGRRCVMSAYVNGVATWPEELESIDPRDVAGVEVYRRPLSAPSEFNASARGRLAETGTFGAPFVAPSCGSIVVWEKDWRSMWDIDP